METKTLADLAGSTEPFVVAYGRLKTDTIIVRKDPHA